MRTFRVWRCIGTPMVWQQWCVIGTRQWYCEERAVVAWALLR